MNKFKFDPQKHHRPFDGAQGRRSIRLKGYDYASEGAYFITMVTQGRECLFGKIVGGEMHLSTYGEIIQKWWDEIPVHFPNVETGAFVIMPNHVHGVIFIISECRGEVISPGNETEEAISHPGCGTLPLCKPTLGQIVGYFKYQSTKEMNAVDNTGTITKFWQRNYYEHIIRGEKELQQKTDYILDNPIRWEEDHEHVQNKNGWVQ